MSSDRPLPSEVSRPIATARHAGVVAACSIALVLGLRWAIDRHWRVVAVDDAVLRWVVERRTPVLTTWFRAITALGDVRLVVAIGAVGVGLLAARRRGDLALILVLSSAGTWLFVNCSKLLVQRSRPPDAVRLVTASGWSFPSGHAGQGAAMYLALGVLAMLTARRRSVQIAAIVAGATAGLLIGGSRVYLGVHWVSDVIAGWSLAIAWLALLLGTTASWRRVRQMPDSDSVSTSGPGPAGPTGSRASGASATLTRPTRSATDSWARTPRREVAVRRPSVVTSDAHAGSQGSGDAEQSGG